MIGIAIGFVQYEMRWIIRRPQNIEAEITGFEDGVFVIGAGTGNKFSDVLRLDPDLNQRDMHDGILVLKSSVTSLTAYAGDLESIILIRLPGRFNRKRRKVCADVAVRRLGFQPASY